MISLRHSIVIQTTAEEVFAWLKSLPREYLSWHSDHVACRMLKGSPFEPGSEMECEEYLHGKLHKMRLRITDQIPGRRVCYQIVGLGHGSFEARAEGEKVEFVAEFAFGTDVPLLGRLFDSIFSTIFQRRLTAMREHIIEEGQNLKAILEGGWMPAQAGHE